MLCNIYIKNEKSKKLLKNKLLKIGLATLNVKMYIATYKPITLITKRRVFLACES